MLSPMDYAAEAKRLEELAYMMRRTALDHSEPLDDRVEELDRLHHRARRRLDGCAALSEVTAAELELVAA